MGSCEVGPSSVGPGCVVRGSSEDMVLGTPAPMGTFPCVSGVSADHQLALNMSGPTLANFTQPQPGVHSEPYRSCGVIGPNAVQQYGLTPGPSTGEQAPTLNSYFDALFNLYYSQHLLPRVQSSSGPQQRVALPDTQEMPIFVNAKQYRCILRRRQQRAKAERENKVVKTRKAYLHESRHLHATKRLRGAGGRFLNADEAKKVLAKRQRAAQDGEEDNAESVESKSREQHTPHEHEGGKLNYNGNDNGSGEAVDCPGTFRDGGGCCKAYSNRGMTRGNVCVNLHNEEGEHDDEDDDDDVISDQNSSS